MAKEEWRMIHLLSNNHTGCWRSIMMGPHKPMVLETKTGILVPKEPQNYSEEDYQKLEVDAKAHDQLAMALPNEIYSGLLHHGSAKDLWDALKEQHDYPITYVLNRFLRSLPGKRKTYSIVMRSSPDFGNLSLT
ncbi:hypothetical protein E3N88_34725 [Mikania micrantha]|uniref:Uncharacterized protein n=1 Tax=Mikania micrantha TaxID=192012 RepID=A0A5N6LYZ6_9ASTR|nr:hypothetical protein E3N88_34725 [Mikania micrantha]